MRAFLILTAALLLAIGVGVAALFIANDTKSGVSYLPSIPKVTIVLLGDGIGAARFGDRESTAIADVERLVGRPGNTPRRQSVEENCGVDSSLSWPAIELYFFHRRFVGYAAGTYSVQPTNGVTAAGLRIGESVAKAKQLYGARLRTSTEQSGAWFARTTNGTVDGFLSANPVRSSSTARIISIEAGDVGCPAMSP